MFGAPERHRFGKHGVTEACERNQAVAFVLRVGGDGDQTVAFEHFEGGGEGSPIHGEEGREFGDARGRRAVERMEKGELAVREADGLQGLIEAARKGARGPLGGEAEAVIADFDGGFKGEFVVHGSKYVDINVFARKLGRVF